MRAALLLLAVLLLGGCTRTLPTHEPPARAITLLTAWTLDEARFVVDVQGAPLPADATVRVVDLTLARNETFRLADLRATNATRWEVPATLPLVAGHRYQFEVVADGATSVRQVRAVGGSAFALPDAAASASYDVASAARENASGTLRELAFRLDLALDAARGHVNLSAQGTGRANLTNDTAAFHFVVAPILLALSDDVLVAESYQGRGDWLASTPQGTGQGEGGMEAHLAGRATPPARSGWNGSADLVLTWSNLTGTFGAGGFGFPIEVRGVDEAWSDPASGDAIWTRTQQTRTVDVFGSPQVSEARGEGAGAAQTDVGGAFALLRLPLVRGAEPSPALPGDAFAARDAQGRSLSGRVEDVPTFVVANRSVAALRVSLVGGGLQVHRTVAAQEPLARLPLAIEARLVGASQNATLDVRLRALSG